MYEKAKKSFEESEKNKEKTTRMYSESETALQGLRLWLDAPNKYKALANKQASQLISDGIKENGAQCEVDDVNSFLIHYDICQHNYCRSKDSTAVAMSVLAFEEYESCLQKAVETEFSIKVGNIFVEFLPICKDCMKLVDPHSYSEAVMYAEYKLFIYQCD